MHWHFLFVIEKFKLRKTTKMIRLKARQEEKKKEEAAAAAAAEESIANGETLEAAGEKKVKILGLGRGKRSSKPKEKKRTPGEIRIQKGRKVTMEYFNKTYEFTSMLIFLDIAELDGGQAAVVSFPDANDLTTFGVRIAVDTGLWKGASYNFTFKIPAV